MHRTNLIISVQPIEYLLILPLNLNHSSFYATQSSISGRLHQKHQNNKSAILGPFPHVAGWHKPTAKLRVWFQHRCFGLIGLWRLALCVFCPKYTRQTIHSTQLLQGIRYLQGQRLPHYISRTLPSSVKHICLVSA